MRYVRTLLLVIGAFFLLPLLMHAQDSVAVVRDSTATVKQTVSVLGSGLVGVLLSVIVPILTGYITQGIVFVLKQVDAIGNSNPAIKQILSFVVAGVVSLIFAFFHTTDLALILNTLIGGALAQLFHNGQKVAQLPPTDSAAAVLR